MSRPGWAQLRHHLNEPFRLATAGDWMRLHRASEVECTIGLKNQVHAATPDPGLAIEVIGLSRHAGHVERVHIPIGTHRKVDELR